MTWGRLFGYSAVMSQRERNVKVFVLLRVQVRFLSPAKLPSDCFLLNLVLSCASETLVKERLS